MCGIVCAFDLKQPTDDLRGQLLNMSKKIRHRGPDWNGIYADEKAILAHERLAIVDPASGKQPLLSEDGTVAVEQDFELICWDFVSNPSTHGAFMSPKNEGVINEGISKKQDTHRYNKAQNIMRDIICEVGGYCECF